MSTIALFSTWTSWTCLQLIPTLPYKYKFIFIMTCVAQLALIHTVLDLIFFHCRLMVIDTLHGGSIPLLAKVDRPSQTAFQQDSNTHMETFGDMSDIFYLEFSLHLKHLSQTINSYMVCLKYDFKEFRSIHWLYTATFAKTSKTLPTIPKQDKDLQDHISYILRIARWIIKESHNPTTRYTDTVRQVNDIISPKDACHYLSHMYYNYTLNIHGFVRNFTS